MGLTDREWDEKVEATIRAAMEKLKALRDPSQREPKYVMMTASPEAKRVFIRMTRKWWQFWRWFV